MARKTRLNLLFGFLGSGKTTLAKRILTEHGPKRRLALIVNEFGDVGVDGEILKGNNIDLIQLASGCLCCTLKGSMQAAVVELSRDNEVDNIVVEATGVAEPEELLAQFAEPAYQNEFDVGPVVTVVDTPKFQKIREMLGPFYEAQVEKADMILLNKIDVADEAGIEEVKEEVLDLNEDAVIRLSEHGDIDLLELLDGPSSGALKSWMAEHQDILAESDAHGHDHEHSHDHPDHDHDHHHGHGKHAPAESFVIDLTGPMDENRVRGLYAEAPETLWRSKGFVRLVDGKDYLVQVAMGQVEITPEPPRDRHYLVFIGDKLDKEFFRNHLKDVEAA